MFVARRFKSCSTGVGYGGQAAIVRVVDEDAVISVTSGVAARLEVFDPGFVRSRRGVRAVCATVLAWATMVAVTSAFDVADPVRITLFAAGAAFEGALLAPDPHPRDRVRTLGWASVVAAVAVVATVALTQNAVWAAAALLVLLMFSSYALRSWSPRVASLALMGAITVYITGAGYITVGRIGWFVLALVVGFGWLALWETLVLPDHPLRSLNLSVQAFSRRAADTVADVVDAVNTARDGTPSDDARKALHKNLERVRRCRSAIETQLPGAVVRGFSQNDVDQLRVALHSAQKGLEDIADQTEDPDWVRSLPDEIAWSISNTLHALAAALRDDVDEESRDAVARKARILRGHIHEALTQATKTGTAPFPPETLLAALSLLAGGEVVAQSVTQARKLAATAPAAVSAALPGRFSRRCASRHQFASGQSIPFADDGARDTGGRRRCGGRPDRQGGGKRAEPRGRLDGVRGHRRIGRALNAASLGQAARHDTGSRRRGGDRGIRTGQRFLDRRRRRGGRVLHDRHCTRLVSRHGVLDEHRVRSALRDRGPLPRSDQRQDGRGPDRWVRRRGGRAHHRPDSHLT